MTTAALAVDDRERGEREQARDGDRTPAQAEPDRDADREQELPGERIEEPGARGRPVRQIPAFDAHQRVSSAEAASITRQSIAASSSSAGTQARGSCRAAGC